MVIYEIVNKVNGKAYVGQTIMEPTKRWQFHRWSLNVKRHVNSKLQNAWNKYGQDSFEFRVIDSAEDMKKLNELETKWIRRYREQGRVYNMTDGGDNALLSDESKQKLKNSLREHYLNNPVKDWPNVVSPEGKEYEIHSMGSFCLDHGLRRDRMKALMAGKVTHHRGWTLKEPKKVGTKKRTTGYHKKGNGRFYRIENRETGEVFRNVPNLTKFAEDQSVNPRTLRDYLYNNRGEGSRGPKTNWVVRYEE